VRSVLARDPAEVRLFLNRIEDLEGRDPGEP